MIRNILGYLCNLWLHTPTNPSTVMRHAGNRQGGYGYLAMAAVSAYQGVQAQGNADKSANSLAMSADQADQMGRRGERISNQFLGRYNSYGLPALRKLIAASQTPVNPDIEATKAAGAVDQAAAGQEQAMNRQEASYGINPNSGRALAERSQFNLDTAVAKAGAATAARQHAIDLTLQRLNMGASAGSNLLNAAETFSGDATQGYSSAGAMYGNSANYYGNVAGGYGQLAGYGLSKYLDKNYPQQPAPQPAPAPTG